jgi:hypothetical protein
MEQWQHLALTLERRYFGTMDDPFSEWVARQSDGTELEGLQNILDQCAAQGWELVSLVPTTWGKSEAKALTAVFKRRKT